MIKRTIITINGLINFVGESYKYGNNSLYYVGGFPNYPNLGDRTLYRAYQELFKQKNLIHYNGGKIIVQASKFLKISGHAILGGGTLINRLSLYSAKSSIDVFKDVSVFGTGVAQASFWNKQKNWNSTIDIWSETLNHCKFVGVRGPLSKKSLDDAGVKNVVVTGDPVLTYAKDEDTNQIDFENKTIGLNIGTSEGKIWGSEDNVAKEYIKLATLLKKEGWKVQWYVVWSKDLEITKMVAKQSGTDQNIICNYNNHEEYFKSVKKLSVFVGLKLHAVIMANCMYVPSIMIEYRPKCLDYMSSINQSDFNYRSDQFSAIKIFDILNEWDKHRTLASSNLYKNMFNLRKLQALKAAELKELFLK